MVRCPLPDGRCIDTMIPAGASPGTLLSFAYKWSPRPPHRRRRTGGCCGGCRRLVFLGLVAVAYHVTVLPGLDVAALVHGLFGPDTGFLILGASSSIPSRCLLGSSISCRPAGQLADDIAAPHGSSAGGRSHPVLRAVAVAAFPLALMQRGTYGSSCPPCDCDSNVLNSCDILAEITSVVWNVDAWNGAINSNVLKLSNKNIKSIRVGAFDDSRFGFASNAKLVRKLDLSMNDAESLEPGVFDGMENLRAVSIATTPSSATR